MRIVAFFVRHGDTDLNDQDKFRGDEDIPLNENGRAQAEELIPLFSAREFSAAFHSSRQRTAQTLQPLMDAKGMKSATLSKLDSLNTGDFTGLPKNDENKKKLEWYRENPDVVIPGGESVAHFRKRVDPKINMIIRKGEEAGKPTIASVHGSVMREISRLFHNGDYNAVKVEPGGIVGIFKTPNGYLAKAIVKENPADEEIQAGS
jgi:broad specificity phosphatase PhoE